jgi:hypothetical protein
MSLLSKYIFSLCCGAALIFSVFYTVLSNGNFINLHTADITDTYHEYKMYDSQIDAMFNRNPTKTCKLIIEANGNYTYDPTSLELQQWLSMCQFHPENFTPEQYRQNIKL